MTQKVRDPVMILILSIITCGIYGYVVTYQIADEIREFTGDQSINPALDVILCIITCGLYNIYWMYKYSGFIKEMQIQANVQYPSDISIPAMILPIFGFSCISLLLIQTELNKVWNAIS